MANFNYTAADLDRTITEVFGGPHLRIEDFGLTEVMYKNVLDLHYDAIEKYSDTLTQTLLEEYGFKNIEEFKPFYVRALLWTTYSIGLKYPNGFDNDGPTFLQDKLNGVYNKVLCFHPEEKSEIPEPPHEGDIYQYLMLYKPEWIFTYGM